MIRACKRDIGGYDTSRLKKVFARTHLINPRDVTDSMLIAALMEIIIDYNLVHDMNVFIWQVASRSEAWEGAFPMAYLSRCMDVIRVTAVNVFPRYPRSAFFRNRYP